MFGVVFPDRSFPIDISTFVQIDTFHWVLDMNTFVGEAYDQVREMCIFLLNSLALPPDKALAVYVQSPGSPFVYCGAVIVSRPSAVLPLPWPEPGGDAATADVAGGGAAVGKDRGVGGGPGGAAATKLRSSPEPAPLPATPPCRPSPPA